MPDLSRLPEDLPAPQDDGAARHLLGMRLPSLALPATNGEQIDLSDSRRFPNHLVVYCYPMTGRPDVPLPEGWDQIPGARGCTPQSCSFRDHYQDLRALQAEVLGLSVQTTAYQQEMVARLHLPFPVVSDHEHRLQRALNLPTFEAAGMTLLKRLTFIARQGEIIAVHYPVFPSDSDPEWVMSQLRAWQSQQPV